MKVISYGPCRLGGVAEKADQMSKKFACKGMLLSVVTIVVCEDGP